MLEVIVFSFIVSLLLVFATTPIIRKLAPLVGALDKPDARKIHKSPIPRLGGVAVFGGFVVAAVAARVLLCKEGIVTVAEESDSLMLGLSLLLVVGLGVCDDIRPLGPGLKFSVQAAAATVVWISGVRIAVITNPFSSGSISLGLFSFPVTLLWIMGITNSFNLIDGLDGLASGIAFLASLTVFCIAIVHMEPATAATAMALAGASLGFLVYNFNPAGIFLGDSGSLLLGFVLAILSVKSASKGSTAFSVAAPLFVLGLPIMDTALAMARRILRYLLPGQTSGFSFGAKIRSVFLPDRRHIHHQLLARGLSHRDAVLVLYSISFGFNACALFATAGLIKAPLALVGFAAAVILAVRKLDYHEMAVIRNGLLLKVYTRTFLKHRISLVVTDFLWLIISSTIALWCASPTSMGRLGWSADAIDVVSISLIELSVFSLSGLYRRSVLLLGLGDFIQIMKAVLVSVFVIGLTLTVVRLSPGMTGEFGFLVWDLYLVATFVIGTRAGFHALNYLSARDSGDGLKTLIYGASHDGLITMQKLLAGDPSDRKRKMRAAPVGFLDDDPQMEGKFLDGYPILGGHWKLEGIISGMGIDEIVIADHNISARVLKRIMNVASQQNVPVKVSKMIIEDVEGRNGLIEESIVDGQVGAKLVPKTA